MRVSLERQSAMKRFGLLFVALVALSTQIVARPVTKNMPRGPGISFSERLRAQEAIERVYYSHQIGTTRPFEEAVPASLIERKVRTYLQQSVALERYWNTPVTEDALAREVNRIRRTTRMPERLQELFTALDNDPIKIRECLARPVLVSRLVRNFYVSDPQIHGSARAEAEALRLRLEKGETKTEDLRYSSENLEMVLESASGGQGRDGKRSGSRTEIISEEAMKTWRSRLQGMPGGVGQVQDEPTAFVIPVLLKDRGDAMTLAMYSVPKKLQETWWKEVEGGLEPAEVISDQLRSHSAPPLQPAQEPEPAVMEEAGGSLCGPADTWDGDDLTTIKLSLRSHTAIWTGSLMVVWGGYGPDGIVNLGRRYDPATDTWEPISTLNAPESRVSHTAVWTGSRMIVWGGSGSSTSLNSGGQYDPASDTWSPTQLTGAPVSRERHSAVWTGSEMLVWGGIESAQGSQGTGGRYDPLTDSWAPLQSTGSPTARDGHVAVWTGTRMVVWGGSVQGLPTDTGGVYSPSSDTWTATSSAGAPSPRTNATAVSTGTQVIVWGGAGSGGVLNSGGRYDPASDTWSPTSTSGAPSAREGATSIWTGFLMIVWGGEISGSYLNTGGRYNPGANSWLATATTGAPDWRHQHSAVWTGNRMIVWGGANASAVPMDTGGRYDPFSNSWTPTSTGAPVARTLHTAVWTGNLMIVWGGWTSTVQRLQTGGRYDLSLNEWMPTNLLSAPGGRTGHTAVWTGTRMIVWGGIDSSASPLGSGGQYDPISDSWGPVSVTGAPSARGGHTAVWTGDRMIIWGGWGTNTGGRYDPDTDSWSPTSTLGAPTPRSNHTAVWTGSRVIVWGGNQFTSSGGRYDPIADTWSPTSLAGAPSARLDHTAVWTGSQMIVWGGDSPATGPSCSYTAFPDTGGRYDPSTDTWSPTSPIPGRAGHSAIWSSSPGTGRMIVWGGDSDQYDPSGCGLPVSTIYPPSTSYDAVSDTWTNLTTVKAPSARSLHTAVYTTDAMLIWGGRGAGGSYLSDGGRYILLENPDVDGDGYSICEGDCNDGDPSTYPGAPELCDGLDDNCNGIVEDSLDLDGDGNSICSGGDCNDSDPGVWDYPVELPDLSVGEGFPTLVSWFDLGPLIGPAIAYDVVSGSAGPGTGISFVAGACVQSGSSTPSYSDSSPNPSPGTGKWYLVRARNSCGTGTYGTSSAGAARILPSCP